MSNAVTANEVAAAKERMEDVRREVARVYVGPSRAVDLMIVALLARGHVLLEGVPGVAKTTLVKAFATALGCSARRIQFTPDLLPADITGTYVLSPRDGTFGLRAGPVFAKTLPFRAPVLGAQTEERIAFKGLRKKISEKMRQSKDKAAHFTYVEEADATALVQLRASAKDMGAQYGIKVTFLPFVMKAMVAALRKYPILNSTLDETTNEIVIKHYFNIGLSIQTDDGLTAPCVKDVANKSVLQLAKEIQDIVDRARAKKLTAEDFAGSTITLTNAGSIGGLFATPVINFPEVAILGFNKIFRKPVVKTINGKEEIVIRDWTYFSISLDHRIVDVAIAAEFMKTFIQYIENPSLLILEG